MSKTVLILGAKGKIGRHSVVAFHQAGWKVKIYNREHDNMESAAQGCNVIINALNPPHYQNWAYHIPKITTEVINAAQKCGATVIVPGNIYHFGNQSGVLSQNTPPNPNSRKGKIRFEMEKAYKNSRIQTIILRAGNFIDPQMRGCVMGEFYLREIQRNRLLLPGPAHIKQAMCYLPDWCRAAVMLAEKRHELQQFEDIPFAGQTANALDIKSAWEHHTGVQLKLKKFPWWIFGVTAPFWELARELNEMRYLWHNDHALCDQRLQTLIPDFQTTSFEQVIAAICSEKQG